MSPWSSKEGTVQTSSSSSVDTVMLIQPHCGYTMGQWRVVQPLSLPSLVQCTLFKLEQNTQQPLLELTMYERWMDTSSSVHMMYWATSSRAMQSSTPSFLLVSFEVHFLICYTLMLAGSLRVVLTTCRLFCLWMLVGVIVSSTINTLSVSYSMKFHLMSISSTSPTSPYH